MRKKGRRLFYIKNVIENVQYNVFVWNPGTTSKLCLFLKWVFGSLLLKKELCEDGGGADNQNPCVRLSLMCAMVVCPIWCLHAEDAIWKNSKNTHTHTHTQQNDGTDLSIMTDMKKHISHLTTHSHTHTLHTHDSKSNKSPELPALPAGEL